MKQAVRDTATAEWRDRMQLRSTLADYRRWKTGLELEAYLAQDDGRFVTPVIEGKRLLTRFRGGASGLRVDTGRWEMFRTSQGWQKLPKDKRTCLVCYGAVEDARHVMLDCPAYCGARQRMLSKMGACLGDAAQNDEIIHRALFGEGKQH